MKLDNFLFKARNILCLTIVLIFYAYLFFNIENYFFIISILVFLIIELIIFIHDLKNLKESEDEEY
jgi:hypothetical protein